MKRYNLLLLIILFFFGLSITKAQLNFARNSNVIVLNASGDTLKNPWAGGFNSVQFSEVDLNFDGIKDLISFDRTGNRLNTFINNGQPNSISYTHAPQYIQYFPKMTGWVLLRDYNCDGKMDIYTSFSGGIKIYKNTSSGTLSFALADSLLKSNYQPDAAPNFIPLYVSNADLPAIDDIDNDGDLDILTFSAAGSYIEYHKNLSIETYGICDSLTYELRNRCWGFVKENASNNSVTLYDTCTFNNNNPEGGSHSGSTLFTLDVDGSGSKDLVLGDAAFNNLTLLYNSDTSPNLNSSSINAQDNTFPSNNLSTVEAKLYVFPAGFYLDVNNDNIKDLVVATNFGGGCKNSENVWLYENSNVTNNPTFNFANNSFLQDGMIEVGEGVHPAFFDYNADGLLDIVIGNYGVYDSLAAPLNYVSSLWVYENIGTLINPAFKLVDMDYAGISTMNLDITGSQPALRLTPTFGDIDGDNDQDMIIGDFGGYLHYFENTAGAGNPAVFVLNQARYQGIDIGLFASPQLIDLNRDNLLDLVIGSRSGYFRYYENIGTPTVPNFSMVTNTLGNVHTKRYNEFNGNSMPYVYDDGSGYKMLSGAINGYIYQFGNIDGNLTGTFSIDSSFQNIWDGASTSVTLSDINNDSYLDMLIGNYSGGIAYYQGDFTTATTIKSEIKSFNVYPNPTNNLIHIDLEENNLANASIEIIDLLGKTIYYSKELTQQFTINLTPFSQGIYLIKFSNTNGSKIQKIVKQ